MKVILYAVVLIAFASAEQARFDNYRFYSVDIENEVQLKALRELSEISDSYNFEDAPSVIGHPIDVIVPPHQFAHWSELIEKFELKVTLNSNNFQEMVDLSSPTKQPKADGDLDWENYHSTEAIHAWMMRLQQTYPQYVTLEDLGYSYEGRAVKLMKISKRSGNRAVFIEANIHSREWISGATATYFIHELLTSTDPEIQNMSETIDWHVIPISNPDGYEYSRTTNRQWRKTRSPSSPTCWGVDPNRNFAYNWLVADETGNLGASTNPCSDTYAGSTPFSEPETTAINNYLGRHYREFDIYLSYHSYAHMILFPLGTTRTRIPNFAEHTQIAVTAAQRLAEIHGIQYRYGSTIELLYAASGVSVDHAWGYYGIPIGYTYEMRGNGPYGNFGFVLPPTLIRANCEEVTASMKGLIAEARNLGYL